MKRFKPSLLLSLLISTRRLSTAFLSTVPKQQSQVTRCSTRVTARFAQPRPLDRDVYRLDKVQDEDWDAIVIGSGIGGLTTASLLAQEGQKVLVLEKHYVAGGACHTFDRKGFRFATGIHYVGEMGNDDTEMTGLQVSLKRLLDTVTGNAPIIWDRMNDNYETVFIGDPPRRYDIVAGQEELQQELMKHFPDEEDAITEYYKLAKRVRTKASRVALLKCLPLPVARVLVRTGLDRLLGSGLFRKCAKTSVQDGLCELTDNKDLQALLAYNYGDYGTEPSKAPYWMQLMLATHYLDGAYYPRGGPSNIPKNIIECINNNGGKVLVSAPVERILVDEETDSVTGVELQDGNVIKSDTIISDAGFINTASKLLPNGLVNVEFAKDDSDDSELLHPGPTGINLFVGINKDAASLNLPKQNVWIHPSNDLSTTAQKLDSMTLDDALECNDAKDLGLVFVGCPCTKDSSWKKDHPGKSALEIISFVPFRWFETFASTFDKKTKTHGKEYETAKTTLAKKQWERVVQVLNTQMDAKLPESLDEVDFYEVGSPLTFAHYYNSKRGAFYGLDNDLKRFEPKTFFLRLRPEVPEAKGLYLAGQDVMVDGLGAAMLGGLLCARKVLGVTNPMSLVK